MGQGQARFVGMYRASHQQLKCREEKAKHWAALY